MKKGIYGYIDENKKKSLRNTIIMFAIVMVIYFVGYFINDRSNANVFTILAILWVLPSSKYLVHYLLIFPYKSIEKTRFDNLCFEVDGSNNGNCLKAIEQSKEDKADGFGTDVMDQITICIDLVFTSTKKVMNLDALIIGESRILGLLGKENQDVSYIEQYLAAGIEDSKFGFDVKIFTKEKEYLNAVGSLLHNRVKEEEVKEMPSNRKDLMLYLKSLVV